MVREQSMEEEKKVELKIRQILNNVPDEYKVRKLVNLFIKCQNTKTSKKK